MRGFSADELERRTLVWASLAELFVARELQEYDYRAIAATLQASHFSIDELDRLLCEEVAPVFRVNLSPFNPVPEMEGWSREFVRDSVLGRLQRQPGRLGGLLTCLQPDPLERPILRERWRAVRALLLDPRRVGG